MSILREIFLGLLVLAAFDGRASQPAAFSDCEAHVSPATHLAQAIVGGPLNHLLNPSTFGALLDAASVQLMPKANVGTQALLAQFLVVSPALQADFVTSFELSVEQLHTDYLKLSTNWAGRNLHLAELAKQYGLSADQLEASMKAWSVLKTDEALTARFWHDQIQGVALALDGKHKPGYLYVDSVAVQSALRKSAPAPEVSPEQPSIWEVTTNWLRQAIRFKEPRLQRLLSQEAELPSGLRSFTTADAEIDALTQRQLFLQPFFTEIETYISMRSNWVGRCKDDLNHVKERNMGFQAGNLRGIIGVLNYYYPMLSGEQFSNVLAIDVRKLVADNFNLDAGKRAREQYIAFLENLRKLSLKVHFSGVEQITRMQDAFEPFGWGHFDGSQVARIKNILESSQWGSIYGTAYVVAEAVVPKELYDLRDRVRAELNATNNRLQLLLPKAAN